MAIETPDFLANLLHKPSYGFDRGGELYIPSPRELFSEYFRRLNVFKDRRNWISLASLVLSLGFVVPFAIFLGWHFSLPLLFFAIGYSMLPMNIHGTAYLHRYCGHRTHTLRNGAFLFFFRNLTIKVFSEEIFVPSHYVHHSRSEKAGDPYNARAGWLYCFLADVIHQPIRKDLSPADYDRVSRLMEHTGIYINSYEQYRRWGSISHPVWTLLDFLFNWAFWGSVFFWIGGLPLMLAAFSGAFFWSISIRNFNYKNHGGGKDKRLDGRDFNTEDLSVNLPLAGIVAGEWHSNHHLFPRSARNGFLPNQPDLTFQFIRLLHRLGIVTSYNDHTERFMERYYEPYLEAKAAARELEVVDRSGIPSWLLKRAEFGQLCRFAAVDWAWILACWGVMGLTPAYLYPVWAVIIGSRFHSLAVVLHDLAHWANRQATLKTRILGAICGFPVGQSYEMFRYHHMQHHRFTVMKNDPDSAWKGMKNPWGILGTALALGLMIIPYFMLRSPLGTLAYFFPSLHRVYARVGLLDETGRDLKNNPEVVQAAKEDIALFACHLVLGWLAWHDIWAVTFYYFIPITVTGLINSYRTYLEHDYRDLVTELSPATLSRVSRDHSRDPLSMFLFAPRALGYHRMHHLHPSVSLTCLPGLYEWYTSQYPETFKASRAGGARPSLRPKSSLRRTSSDGLARRTPSPAEPYRRSWQTPEPAVPAREPADSGVIL
jgi:fatty-acid desaturase